MTNENRPRVASKRGIGVGSPWLLTISIGVGSCWLLAISIGVGSPWLLAIGAACLQLTLDQSWSSSPQLSISFTSLSSLEWSGRFVSDVIVARISIS
jgi:hypothetical protein